MEGNLQSFHRWEFLEPTNPPRKHVLILEVPPALCTPEFHRRNKFTHPQLESWQVQNRPTLYTHLGPWGYSLALSLYKWYSKCEDVLKREQLLLHKTWPCPLRIFGVFSGAWIAHHLLRISLRKRYADLFRKHIPCRLKMGDWLLKGCHVLKELILFSRILGSRPF